MRKYIDSEKLIAEHCSACNEEIQAMCKADPICATLMWIVDAPAEKDVVKVVRCKDCVHSKESNGTLVVGARYCDMPYGDPNMRITVWDTDYCSYGEKKDDTN